MKRPMDITGEKFNRWTVLGFDRKEGKIRYWLCQCDCGTKRSIEQYSLVHGLSKSCGCLIIDNLKERFVDLTGKKIGKWTVLYKAENHGNHIFWHCICECGTERDVAASNLLSETSTSCGCKRIETTKISNSTHGMRYSRLYSIYRGMIGRCTKENNKSYEKYGAKGITVCQEWQGENGFVNFAEWALSNGYEEDLTLDRYPNQDGNYEPSNCRWATYKQQANNVRKNVLITKDGVTHTMSEWCEILGLSYHMVASRHKNGWDEDKLLIPPVRKSRKE